MKIECVSQEDRRRSSFFAQKLDDIKKGMVKKWCWSEYVENEA